MVRCVLRRFIIFGTARTWLVSQGSDQGRGTARFGNGGGTLEREPGNGPLEREPGNGGGTLEKTVRGEPDGLPALLRRVRRRAGGRPPCGFDSLSCRL